jgi:hypothetical protein
MRTLGTLLFGTLLVVGCRSAISDAPSQDAGTSGTPRVASDGLARGRLAEARRVATADVLWSAVLSPRGAGEAKHALRAGDLAFVTEGYLDARGGVPMAFGGRASRFADGALEVRAGDAQVALKVEGAAPVEGSLVDDELVYPDAQPSTDFVVGSAPGRVEAFWLLRDARAPRSFTLHLALEGLTARLRDGDVELADAQGVLRLRLPRPSAIDANGTRRAATLSLVAEALTITLDPSQSAYPILLDPALEQVAWTDLGPDVPTYAPPLLDPPRITFPATSNRAGATARSGDNGRVYMFNGATVAGGYGTLVTSYVTQLLEWNGTAWAASAGGNFTGTLSDAGTGNGTVDRLADFVWDPVRKRLVLFGGIDHGPTGSKMLVYEYDPSAATKAWVQVCGSACTTSAPTVSSTPTAPTAAWAFGKAMLLHSSGTWSWDPATTTFTSISTALARAGAGLAFDANRNRLVAYGDRTGLTDTWELSGTTWTKSTAVGPKGVKNPSLAYHAGRKEVVLWASDWTSGGLWTWNGTAWTALTILGTGPSVRPNAAFTYDVNVGRLLLAGGGDLGAGSWSNCFEGLVTYTDDNKDLRTCARIDTWTSVLFGGACATAADCVGGTTCVDAVCCRTACNGPCQRCDAAGTIGTCASVVSAVDPDTCTGGNTCDAAGNCRRQQGQACALGTDCLSGNCADGICCNNACPGACEACNQAGSLGTCAPLPKGAAGTGCGAYVCAGGSAACGTTCAADGDCATSAFCTAGSCVPVLGRGAACLRDRQCGTGVCVDGACCNSPCGGPCDVCAKALGATVDGTCAVLAKTSAPAECGPARCSGTSAACGTSCSVDADCSASGACEAGVCVALRKKGESCARTAQCGTGLSCADGVCCNEACDGACRACAAPNKESGDKSGECGPAKEGSNPQAKCAKSAAASCGPSGFCDATGVCALYAAGTACGASGSTSCDGENVKGQTCDGLGACIDSSGTPCTPGRCVSGACKSTCTVDADCAADAWCSGGSCKKRAAAGAKCSIDAQCATGVCADGVCCNARCDGACEACDRAGTEGTCTAIAGLPRLGHPACAAAPPGEPCSAAVCDGVERARCAKQAGAETACRAGSCEAGIESLPATCDGAGACSSAQTRPCQPFACGADACKKSCADDRDCKAGFVCNTATAACTLGDTCVGSVVTHVDGSTVDCAPYVCESGGRCKTTCTITADCLSPKICDGAACVDPVDAATAQAGGCAASPGGVRSFGALVLLGALVSALRRRRGRVVATRRRARRSSPSRRTRRRVAARARAPRR